MKKIKYGIGRDIFKIIGKTKIDLNGENHK